MKALIPTLAAATLALAATFAFAQGTPGYGPGMGSQGMRPGGGPGMQGERHEQMKAAYEACKDKPDRRVCMTEQYCAKSANPAECQAKARERHARMSKRMDEHQKAAEACTGKRGDELQKCYREQRQKSGHDHGPKG